MLLPSVVSRRMRLNCGSGPASLNVAGSRIRTIEVQLAGIEKCAFVSDIAHLKSVVGSQLPGYLKVPVLDVRIDVLAVRLNRDYVVEGVLRNESDRDRILDRGDRIRSSD